MAIKGRGLPPRELRRKVFHIALGTSFLVLLARSEVTIYIALVLFLAGFALSVAHRRRSIAPVGWLLVRFDRETDQMAGMGIITFFLGVLLTWILFPGDAAIAGIAVMTFGDPMASVIGITLGRHRAPWNPKKTVEGTLAFVVAAFLVLLPFAGPLTAGAGAVAGAAVESFRHPKGSIVNDNVSIPIGAAAMVSLVTWIF